MVVVLVLMSSVEFSYDVGVEGLVGDEEQEYDKSYQKSQWGQEGDGEEVCDDKDDILDVDRMGFELSFSFRVVNIVYFGVGVKGVVDYWQIGCSQRIIGELLVQFVKFFRVGFIFYQCLV